MTSKSKSKSTLFPGYTQVASFGEDDEYEHNTDGDIEEEVVYVTLDLGQVEPTLIPSTSSYRLIGLDTPTPYLQLSGSILKGQHQELLGTEMLFTEPRDDQNHHDRTKKPPLLHFGSTSHRIKFQEIELKSKPTSTAVPGQEDEKTSTYSSSSKNKRPQTMEQLVGGPSTEQATQGADGGQSSETGVNTRGRGGRRGRGGTRASRKSKGKEKATAEQATDIFMANPEETQAPISEQQSQGSVPMDIDTT